ncbi:MAG: peptidoglycan DD-metalloendopeptidase family protein, partial [Nitrospinota bacterium]|nr:peptidoglycan DD-metalloendopeptidase family protein [Nitrospinota bacterium]
MSITSFKAILFVFLISMESVPIIFAEENNIKEINTLLKDEQAELKILRKKIKKQEIAISKVGKSESAALKNLQVIENQLRLKERELKIYKWNFKNNQKKLLSIEPRLKKMELKINAHKKILGFRLRSIYKEGSVLPMKIMFSSNDINDLFQNLKYMNLIAQHDAQLLRQYKSQYDKFDKDKRSLYAVRAKLVSFEKNAKYKKDEIVKKKKEKSVLLKKIKKKKYFYKKVRKELVAASTNLNELIDKLLVKIVSGEGLDISDKKGRLDMPLNGRILNKFGKKRVKEYDSFIVYNGINVRAQKGTHVRAIFDGTVVYTGELEGYGNLIIIGHGKEFHSLYGHLDVIKV